MTQRDERLYFAEILEAIDGIVAYTTGGREAFFSDPRTQDAEVPWSNIAGTRDRVIHGYFEVDLEIIWEVVEKELSGLRDRIAALLQGA